MTIGFYVIEYHVDGEVDIKHAFMSDAQAFDLCKKLSLAGVKHEIHCLSKHHVDVKLLDEGNSLDESH